MFVTEHAAVQQAEPGRGDARQDRQYGPAAQAVPGQHTHGDEHQAVSHVTEHHAEHGCEGQREQQRRVEFPESRHTVLVHQFREGA